MRKNITLLIMIIALIVIFTLNSKYILAEDSSVSISVGSFQKFSKRSISNYPQDVPITIIDSQGKSIRIRVPVKGYRLPPGTYIIVAPESYTDPWGVKFQFHSWIKKGITTQIIRQREIKITLTPGENLGLILRFTFATGFYKLSLKLKDDQGNTIKAPGAKVKIYRKGSYYGNLKYHIGEVTYWKVKASKISSKSIVTPYLWSDKYMVALPTKFIGPDGYAYYFSRWIDGTKSTKKSISLSSDKTIIAYYTRKPLIIIDIIRKSMELTPGSTRDVLVKITSTLYKGKVALAVKINGALRTSLNGLSVGLSSTSLELSQEQTKSIKLTLKANKNIRNGRYIISIIIRTPYIKYKSDTIEVRVVSTLNIRIIDVFLEGMNGKRISRVLPLEQAKIVIRAKVLKGNTPLCGKKVNIEVCNVLNVDKLRFMRKQLIKESDKAGCVKVELPFRAMEIKEAKCNIHPKVRLYLGRVSKEVVIPIRIEKPKIEYSVVHEKDAVILRFRIMYADGYSVTNRSNVLRLYLKGISVNVNVTDSGEAWIKIPYDSIRSLKKIPVELHYKPFGIVPLLNKAVIPTDIAYIKITYFKIKESSIEIKAKCYTITGKPVQALYYIAFDNSIVAKSEGTLYSAKITVKGNPKRITIIAIPYGSYNKIILWDMLSVRTIYARLS